MRARPTIYSKKPFPRNFHTRVDLPTPMSIQTLPEIAPDLKVYFLKTTVSFKAGEKPKVPHEPIKTKTGMLDPTARPSRYKIPHIVSTDPSQRVFTQKEVFEDIVSAGISSGFDIPDTIICERCSVVKLPKVLEDIALFDGVEQLLLHEKQCSFYTRWIGQHYNLKMKSPAKIARNILVEENIMKYADFPIKRMRSVLQLRSMIGVGGTKTIGWGDVLYDPKNKTDVSEQFSDALCGTILQDTAEPRRYSVNGLAKLTLYRLKRMGRMLALNLGPEWI